MLAGGAFAGWNRNCGGTAATRIGAGGAGTGRRAVGAPGVENGGYRRGGRPLRRGLGGTTGRPADVDTTPSADRNTAGAGALVACRVAKSWVGTCGVGCRN